MYWVNGVLSDTVSLDNRALHFGDGFFTTAKLTNGKIDFLDWHIERLDIAAKRLMFGNFDIDIVHQEMQKAAVIGMNGFIKVIISRKNNDMNAGGYRCVGGFKILRIIYTGRIPKHYSQWLRFGIKIKTSAIRLARNHFLAGIKHLNRLEQVMIANWIYKHNNIIDEALVLDTAGNIVECCSANVFWRKKHQVFTPSVRDVGVNGIIRQLVLKLLPKLGYFGTEVIVSPKYLKNADEVFITNSLLPIVSVNTVDDISYKNQTLFSLLRSYL